MIKTEIYASVKEKLEYIYQDFSKSIEKDRLDELYNTIAPRILNACDVQLGLIEEEFNKGLIEKDRGIFRISHSRVRNFFIFGYDASLLKKDPDVFAPRKLTKEDLLKILNDSIHYGDNKFQIRLLYKNFLSRSHEEQQRLKTIYLKERFLDKNRNIFLNKKEELSLLPLEQINNLNYICLHFHKIKPHEEMRFVNMLFSTFGGTAISTQFNRTPEIIGTFYNSVEENKELLFSLYIDHKDTLNSLQKMKLMESFFRQPNGDTKEYELLFNNELFEIFNSDFFPQNLHLFNKIIDKNLINSFNKSNHFNKLNELIVSRFPSDAVTKLLSNIHINNTIKKLFKRNFYVAPTIETKSINLFSISEQELNSWGGEHSHMFNGETICNILKSINIKHILTKENGVKFKIDIFLESHYKAETLISFIRQIMCDIDDNYRSSYIAEQELLHEWKAFHLTSLVDNTLIKENRKKPKV